jgi:hypothetical protein
VFKSKAFGPADPSESFLISQLPTSATVLIVVEDVCIVQSHSSGASLPKGFGKTAFLSSSRLTLLSDHGRLRNLARSSIWHRAGRLEIKHSDTRTGMRYALTGDPMITVSWSPD